MNKEIEKKLDELILFIQKSDSYKNYLKSKELLENKHDLKDIISNIKKYQQEIVKNPLKKEELTIKLNNNINILQNDETYIEYTKYLSEVNNMLAIFENKINKYFDNIFNTKN